jgi:protein tyrosine phosphatase (PTP) superfamily phosphohydrolase (DUF442 family)
MNIFFKVSVVSLSLLSFASNSAPTDKLVVENNAPAIKSVSLTEIKNFRQVSPILASAGMPKAAKLAVLKHSGYQHVINLIPGDFSKQQHQVNALGMSFEQISVDWHEPKLEDFQKFVALMDQYQQDNVFVHCRLNYRASAFVYLYETTQLGKNEETSRRQMLSVWQPEGTWLNFINEIQQYYQAQSEKI